MVLSLKIKIQQFPKKIKRIHNVCHGKKAETGKMGFNIYTLNNTFYLSSSISSKAHIHQVKDNLAKTTQQLVPAVFTNTWGKPVGSSRIQVCWLGMACIPFLTVYPLVGLPAFDLLTNGLPLPSFSFPPSRWVECLRFYRTERLRRLMYTWEFCLSVFYNCKIWC